MPRSWVREEVEDASLGAWTRELGITPQTNECRGSWGGFDLGIAVGAVVKRGLGREEASEQPATQ